MYIATPGTYKLCLSPRLMQLTVKGWTGTDISQLDNAIYIEDLSIPQSVTQTTIPVKLKNSRLIGAYSFDLALPEGMEIANGGVSLSNRHGSNYSVSANKREGQDYYAIGVISMDPHSQLTGNDGDILYITLSIPENTAQGTYSIIISNVSGSDPEGVAIELPNTTSIITIDDFLLGDVNGDGKVNIADAVCIVNWIVGKPNAMFIEKAVDINHDGKKTIADAVTIVNLVVSSGGSNGAAGAKPMVWDTRDPE